jgi:hypothetical protein
MLRPKSNAGHRPRELRRRVVLPARMLLGSAWSDACILNISSRGMLIQASRGVAQGSAVELHRGDYVVLARVVWRHGARAGLQVDERLQIGDILMLGQVPGVQLTAAGSLLHPRRKLLPTHDVSRLRSRAMEFAGIAFIAVSLSAAALAMVQEAFARPLSMIELALGR